MADGGVAILADGTETVWRCARCGAGIVPQNHRQRFCSSPCRIRHRDARFTPEQVAARRDRSDRWQERNASYHRARAALRKRGLLTPAVEEIVRSLMGRGEASAAEIAALYARCGVGRARPRRASPVEPPTLTVTSAWSEPSPVLARPLCVALSLSVPARRALDHFDARLLHAALTRALGIGHEPRRPAFGLILPRAGIPGAVVCFDPRAESLRSTHAMLGSARVLVELGARSRLRAPPPREAGSYRARVVTAGALVMATGATGEPLPQRAPATLTAQLEAVAHRLRLDVPRVEARVLSCDLAPCDVRVGGHYRVGAERGVLGASYGSLVVECNATGRWLLDCAALVGLGAKTALGFGRVRVVDA